MATAFKIFTFDILAEIIILEISGQKQDKNETRVLSLTQSDDYFGGFHVAIKKQIYEHMKLNYSLSTKQ
jgi:hypothetical protein